MDSDNLLSFNSPVLSCLKNSDTVVSTPRFSVSPGNNPFDDLIKKVSVEEDPKSNDTPNDQDTVSTSENDRLESSIMKNSLPDISQNKVDDVFKIPSIAFSNCDSPFKLNNSFDIRRESMPFTFNELDLIDAGRPSLLFNQTFNLGRESLGILNLSSARDSLLNLNLSARESLGILHHLPGLECGLTTDLNPPMLRLDEESTVEDSKASDSVQNCFNTAFLYPNIKHSVSSISSLTSVRSSFGSANSAISEISKIYSLPSSLKSSDTNSMSRPNFLNDAFVNSSEYSKRLELSSLSTTKSPLKTNAFLNIINSPELNNFRNKILSLPEPLKTEEESHASLESAKRDLPKFWSAEKTNKRKAVVRQRSFCGVLNFDEEEDVNFNDSVFIEANHLASRIANGSIVDSDPVTEDILESTTPPELCEDNHDNEETRKAEKQATTYNEQAIFKVVDKMLPPHPNPDLKFSLKLKKSNTSKCNLSNTSNTSRKSTSVNITKSSENSDKDNSSVNISKRSNKSKEAKDLIYNLSEILNSTNKSEQQKSEGQQLLESLASILAQSPENQNFNNMEDSGHSSLVVDTENDMNAANIDKHECYEVLDLRTSRSRSESDITNNTGNQEQPAILDLSVKSRSNERIGRRISLSFNLPRAKVLPSGCDSSIQSASSLELTNNNNSRPSVNGSLSSNSAGSFGSNRSSFCKLRTKRSDGGAVKKGPLRAVIPFNSLMKKQKSYEQPANKPHTLDVRHSTPPATPQRLENLNSQNKKTSTPINHQSKLKPMAASTPDAQLSKMRSSMSYQKNVQNNVQMPPPNQLKVKASSSNTDNNKRHSTIEKSLPKDKVSSSSSSVSSKSSSARHRDSLSITGKPSLPLSTLRRHSVSDLKKNPEPNMRQKRSNSTGKEVGIMSALSRVRESITKSPFYKSSFGGSTGGSSLSKQSSSGLSENLKQSRNSNLISTLKKYGKENKKF